MALLVSLFEDTCACISSSEWIEFRDVPPEWVLEWYMCVLGVILANPTHRFLLSGL